MGDGMQRDFSVDQFGIGEPTQRAKSRVICYLFYSTLLRRENMRPLTDQCMRVKFVQFTWWAQVVTERDVVAVGDGMQRSVIQTVVGGTVCGPLNGVYSVPLNDAQCSTTFRVQ